jgi:hypothetical protein
VTLTPAEVAVLRSTLDRARSGGATLGELGQACDLAARSGLPGCSAELRQHLARQAGSEPPRRVARDVVLGVATGALTHYLLRGV